MQAFENTVTIQRPAEEVFAFLADFENVPMWNYAIEDTRKTSAGPVGVGTRYRQTRTIPSRTTEEFEVTVFQPGQPAGDPRTDRALPGNHQLRASGSGRRDKACQHRGTRARPARLRLLAPLATPKIKAAVAQNLGTLTQVLESGNPA